MKTIVSALILVGLLSGCATAKRGFPSVAESPPVAEESYSFLIVPCFRPPEEYRVMVRDARYWIGKQGYDGAGGYSYQKNASYEEVEITCEEWRAIREPLLAAGFWGASVVNCEDFVVLDGDSLRISGARGRERKEVFLRDAYYKKDLSHFTVIAAKTWQTFKARREDGVPIQNPKSSAQEGSAVK